MAEELIAISKKEYEALKQDSNKLEALVCFGVDNWCGYDEAMSEYYSYEEN